MKSFHRLSCLFTGLLLVAATLPLCALAEGQDSLWTEVYKSCIGLSDPHFQDNTKKFQDFLKQGTGWDQRVVVQRAALNKLVNVSCPAYLASPNGDGALSAFIKEYTGATTAALLLKKDADAIENYFDSESQRAEKYFLQMRVLFKSTPCAKAMQRTKAHFSTEKAWVENKFAELKSKCPAIADAQTAQVISAKNAEAAAKAIAKKTEKKLSGKSKPGESDVTGVQEDIEKQKLKP
jgi:hypothetical protein